MDILAQYLFKCKPDEKRRTKSLGFLCSADNIEAPIYRKNYICYTMVGAQSALTTITVGGWLSSRRKVEKPDRKRGHRYE